MRKEEYVRKCWLLYFNRALADVRVISQEEYRKVKLKIIHKYSDTLKAKNVLGVFDFL